MQIAGYLKTSVIEWSGKITSVIFTPGCSFRCPFCHNGDLVRMKDLSDYNEQLVLEDFKKRQKWLDGVVITGGEPTLQADLPEFLTRLKKLGLATMVETNGSRPEMISQLVSSQIVNSQQSLVDYWSIDYKTRLEDYNKAIGIKGFEVDKWRKSLQILAKSGVSFEIRTTIVPGIHNLAVLRQMARELRRLLTTNNQQLKTHPVWYWQNFRPGHCLDLRYNQLKPYSQDQLKKMISSVEKIYPQIKLRI